MTGVQTCALPILLLLATIFLGAEVVHMVWYNKSYSYEGLTIYAVAAYDFVALTSAIIYMVRTAHKHRPIIKAIKMVRLATSMVASLALQTAMFVSFGSDSTPQFQKQMNIMTGGAVCIGIVLMGGFMCFKACHELKKIKETRVQDD